MALTVLPQVERMTLVVIEAVPDWHPEHDTFEPFPVHAWLVRHPDGPILVDTGVGIGNALIDEWYSPRVTAIGEALGAIGIEVEDVAAVVRSHLHFDHCGQQAAVGARLPPSRRARGRSRHRLHGPRVDQDPGAPAPTRRWRPGDRGGHPPARHPGPHARSPVRPHRGSAPVES